MNNQSVYLTAYFSPGYTTRNIALSLAQQVFSDIQEIKPKEPYTEKDLNWKWLFSRCNKEHLRKILPEIEAPTYDLSQYSIVFLGFPIWYGKAPNIIKSFLRLSNWSGQRIVLFATSGGSGIEKAEADLKQFLGADKVAAAHLFDSAADWDEIGEWGRSILEHLDGELKKSASEYVSKNYIAPPEPAVTEPDKREPAAPKEVSNSGSVRFSRDLDEYNRGGIRKTMQSIPARADSKTVLKTLDRFTDQSFVSKLLQLIRERGMNEPDVYKAALIDRRLFSRIISDAEYKPSKDTCVALAYALHLDLQEANDLMSRAGYTFSHSSKRDLVLEYFFVVKNYDIYDINEVLFQLFQKPLGRSA